MEKSELKSAKVFEYLFDIYGNNHLFATIGDARTGGKHASECIVTDLYYRGEEPAQYAFRLELLNGTICTPWFDNEEDCATEANRMLREVGEQEKSFEDYIFTYAKYHNNHLKPVELPVIAILSKSDRGLYCKLNLHPEEDGAYATGKPFFPDRNCKEPLEEGFVVVESVKDKGNYGFFTGKMKTFDAPSEVDVVNYLFDKFGDRAVYKRVDFVSGGFGTLARYCGDNNTYLFKGTESPVEVIPSELDTNFVDTANVVRSVSVFDLVCQNNLCCSYDELYKRVSFPKFAPVPVSTKLRGVDHGFCDILESAVDTDVFVVYEYQGAVYLLPDILVNLAIYFSKEEAEEILKEVERVNSEFDERLTSLSRKGKISVEDLKKAAEYKGKLKRHGYLVV